MSDDIVARLRNAYSGNSTLLDEAADEIERLRAELAAEREKAFTAMRVFERYRELEAQIDTLRELLREARDKLNEAADEIHDWGAYADKYFQEKHDLIGCVQDAREAASRIDAALKGEGDAS